MLTKQKTAVVPAPKVGKRKRPQLGIIVSQETKDRIERLAQASGRSQGQVVEQLIERAILYDSVIAAMNRTLDDIRRGHIEEAFRGDGYTPVKTPYGQIWLPPNHPLAHRSDFEKGLANLQEWTGRGSKEQPK
jgi:predicted DNA-binding protein